MGRIRSGILFASILIFLIVAVDLIFFKDHFRARLMANIGITLLVGAFYFRYTNK